LLGAFVMLLWLLVPVARCSYHAFRDTPIGEVDPNNAPNEADADRIQEGKGFVGKVWSGTKKCYAQTPLLGQERWKSTLLILFAGLSLSAYFVYRIEVRRKRTFIK
jgi:hypothetical protein